ncbi:MAG: hypothetical protein M3458_08580 [Acidobacteriota bacterium]|nr:hypothetical protein [Acidobacteriota bacterium]
MSERVRVERRAIVRSDGVRAARPQGRAERIAPPHLIKCPRNNLTSYNGKVILYRRQPGRTVIRVRTDWETNEQVVIKYARNANPTNWFLLKGEPFAAADWRRIEVTKNRLRPEMRANIWVCDDGTNPVVDWRPPTDEQPPSR